MNLAASAAQPGGESRPYLTSCSSDLCRAYRRPGGVEEAAQFALDTADRLITLVDGMVSQNSNEGEIVVVE